MNERKAFLAASLADGKMDQAEIASCLKETEEAIQALAALQEALKAESGGRYGEENA